MGRWQVPKARLALLTKDKSPQALGAKCHFIEESRLSDRDKLYSLRLIFILYKNINRKKNDYIFDNASCINSNNILSMV